MFQRRTFDGVARTSYVLNATKSHLINIRDRWSDPAAVRFFRTLHAGGYDPDAHIDVLPDHRVVYICVPKAASTTIKSALARLCGRSISPSDLHSRRRSGLPSPRYVGLSTFHRLAICPGTLRFSFVRNPYARLVSAWADKFQNKPLVAGDGFVDQYLTYRRARRSKEPEPDQALSFQEFTEFACATAEARLNAHWAVQDDMLKMPGIDIDFIGKVETFGRDFVRVLEHAGVRGMITAALTPHHNISQHQAWQRYYDDALAARVYRAYERDFDRFGYTRAFA